MKQFYFLVFLWLSFLFVNAQPYIMNDAGLGTYGYLEKDATTYIKLNSGNHSNIYQLYGRTWISGPEILTYGTADGNCHGQYYTQTTNDYNFLSQPFPGAIAYTAARAQYCDLSNSGNFNEIQHMIFDLSDRPADVSTTLIAGQKNVVMSLKIDFGTVNDRKLDRFWIRNNGSLQEGSEIQNDAFQLYYEPATGSEVFNGNESSAFIFGNYNANPTNNNEYGHDNLNITIPSGGLRVYVVIENFNTCATGKTLQLQTLNDGLRFEPAMHRNLARVNSTPASPAAVTYIPPAITHQSGSTNQNLIAYNPAENIVYQISNFAGTPTVTDLPAGMSYSYASGILTISGTPSVTGTFTYTVSAGCATATGTISIVHVLVDWANLQYPKHDVTVLQGSAIPVFAQVRLLPETHGNGQSSGIEAWIGYSTVNAVSEADFATANWTWVPAVYNVGYEGSPSYQIDNDEYWIENFGQTAGNAFTNATGDYYYVARFRRNGSTEFIYGGSDDTDNNASGGIWNGTTYTTRKITVIQCNPAKTWNGSSWSPSAPTINDEVIIEGNFNTTTNGNFSACKCTVNSEKTLTIAANNAVTLRFGLINNGVVTVENDGNLIQQNNYGINQGFISVKRNAKVKRNHYNYWASPVAGQNLKEFSPLTYNNRFYTYKEQDDYFYTINPLTNIFGNSSAGEFESEAKAYAIRGPAGYATEQDLEHSFHGLPNNGIITFPLKQTNPVFDNENGGFNLVGNPYPSNIDFYQLADNNSDYIIKAAYFWTNLNPNPAMQGSNYPQAGWYNNYAVLNGSGGVPATMGTTATTSAIPNQYIRPGQGFLVKTKTDADLAELTYSNDIRTDNSSAIFFNSRSTPQTDRYWIQLITPLGVVTTQLIAHISGATNGLDLDYDAPLPGGVASDASYTLLSSAKLIIQGRPSPVNPEDIIGVGASFFADGNYTFRLWHKEGVFNNGMAIYLIDHQLNTYVNLQEVDYNFAALQGIDESRFEIRYLPPQEMSTSEETITDSAVQIYKDGDDFVLKSQSAVLEISAYNTAGQLLLSEKVNDTNWRVNRKKLPVGVIFFRIQHENSMVNKKVLNH